MNPALCLAEVDELAAQLQANLDLLEQAVCLDIDDFRIRVCSNSAELLARLQQYFGHVVVQDGLVDIEILAFEQTPPQLDVQFEDWRREPGKKGRKDSYIDLPGARLIRKVRTGMVFLQSEMLRIAAGPCVDNDNQVINFINAQYMNHLQQHGGLICHAAALEHKGRGLAMAGFSGGGKSTLMLHMLEQADTRFMSNDRLFVMPDGVAAGVPKLPRINPGTIVHSERLKPLIAPARREELLALPQQELWDLEEKYDVDVEALYGRGRIRHQAPLDAVLLLNWSHDSDQPCRLAAVDLQERRDLLAALMKSSGPFYQTIDGRFLDDLRPLDEDAYLARLAGIAVYEVSGRVDFQYAARQGLEKVSA